MTSLICHFEYYHIWQKIGNAVYFDNIKYLLLQIFRDDRYLRQDDYIDFVENDVTHPPF